MNETQKESHAQRKLISGLTEQAQEMMKTFENLNTIATGARRQLGEALHAIARIEAILLEQAYRGRKSDQLVCVTEQKLNDVFSANSALVTSLQNRVLVLWDKVAELAMQIDRTVNDDGLRSELLKPIEGVDYVDMKWICERLRVSEGLVRQMIGRGEFTPHHAVISEAETTKHLWVRVKAEIEIARIKANKPTRATRAYH